MTMKKTIVWFVFFAAFLSMLFISVGRSSALPPPEPLSSFQCSGGVASVGDTASDVTAKCGEPSTVKKIGSEILKREEWIYNFRSSKKLYFLEFQRGKLQKIQSGGY
jgi:hypothetical protein